MSVTTVLIVGVVVVGVIARRLYGEPLRARRLFVAPLAELVIGGYEIVQHGGLAAGQVLSLVVTGVLSFALGAGRGATVHLFERRGYLWQRYRPLTFLVWIGAFVTRFGVRALFAALGVTATTAIDVHALTTGHRPEFSGALIGTMLITSALGFVGESLVLVPRAMATGVPFAPAGVGGGLLGGLLDTTGPRTGPAARVTSSDRRGRRKG
ncbi:MAG TPA: hypothetical protein VGN37_09150 [Actinocatenispora sp.]